MSQESSLTQSGHSVRQALTAYSHSVRQALTAYTTSVIWPIDASNPSSRQAGGAGTSSGVKDLTRRS